MTPTPDMLYGVGNPAAGASTTGAGTAGASAGGLSGLMSNPMLMMALMGGMQAQSQNKGQMVDLGNGYKAYFPTGAANAMGNTLSGASQGALQGAMMKWQMDEAKQGKLAEMAASQAGMSLLQKQRAEEEAKRQEASQAFQAGQLNKSHEWETEKEKRQRAEKMEDFDRNLSIKQGDTYTNLRTEAAKAGADLPYGPLAPEYIQNQTAKANAAKEETQQTLRELSLLANLKRAENDTISTYGNLAELPTGLIDSAGKHYAGAAQVVAAARANNGGTRGGRAGERPPDMDEAFKIATARVMSGSPELDKEGRLKGNSLKEAYILANKIRSGNDSMGSSGPVLSTDRYFNK